MLLTTVRAVRGGHQAIRREQVVEADAHAVPGVDEDCGLLVPVRAHLPAVVVVLESDATRKVNNRIAERVRHALHLAQAQKIRTGVACNGPTACELLARSKR